VIDLSTFNKQVAYVDTFQRAVITSVSAASVGSNQNWNYSSIVNDGFGFLQYYDASDSTVGYPPAHHFSYLELLSPSGSSIDAWQFNSLDNNGYYISALYVEPYTENLAQFSGGANDELVVPAQRYAFPDTFYFVKFPATNQSSWNSSNTRRVNFTITLGGFGLNQAPGYFQDTEVETRTVIGDGQIIIPDENGNAMPAVDVFLIEAIGSSVDSIFLAGSPAPAALLSPFGLTQGATTNYHYYLFYPVYGSGDPVAAYSVNANGDIIGFTYRPRAVREIQQMGIAEQSGNLLNLYPNPTTGLVMLSQEVNHAVLYNLQGQKLMEVNGSSFDISSLQSGIYMLQVDNQFSIRIVKK
jgi:hypothetical protein